MPSQPSVEIKVPTAGDLIFAREQAKLTSIQKAIQTGTSAIPSLRQGEMLIKFNKGSSKNIERYVMLLDKTNMMVWGSIEKLTSNLNLRDVLGISLGMGSSTLRRAYCAEDHHTLPKLTNGNVAWLILLWPFASISFSMRRSKCSCAEFSVFSALCKSQLRFRSAVGRLVPRMGPWIAGCMNYVLNPL
jgi:hypothetical protein